MHTTQALKEGSQRIVRYITTWHDNDLNYRKRQLIYKKANMTTSDMQKTCQTYM